MTAMHLCVVLIGMPPTAYPRAELLVEPEALVTPRDKAIYLDTRPPTAYQAGHIPGALSVSASAWSRRFIESRDPEVWGRFLGDLGLSPDREIIVYGSNWTESARVWWILRYWEFAQVRIMNGPFSAWIAAGGKPTTDQPMPTPVKLRLTPTTRWVDKQELLESIKESSVQIVDVRTEKEYRGETGGSARSGSIPGAKHLEWTEFIDPKTQRLKPSVSIAQLLKETGIDLTRPTVTYCHAGGRSSVSAFVLELMGGQAVRNYLRGWSEWGESPDTPVALPPKK